MKNQLMWMYRMITEPGRTIKTMPGDRFLGGAIVVYGLTRLFSVPQWGRMSRIHIPVDSLIVSGLVKALIIFIGSALALVACAWVLSLVFEIFKRRIEAARFVNVIGYAYSNQLVFNFAYFILTIMFAESAKDNHAQLLTLNIARMAFMGASLYTIGLVIYALFAIPKGRVEQVANTGADR